MRSAFLLSALAAVAAAAPQGVTSAISPTSPMPAGCSASTDGTFQITVVNVTSSKKRDLQKRDTLTLTLQGGILHDALGRTGYVADNYQFQFDKPPQTGAIYTSGFSLCSNGSLALGGKAIWYQCLSGGFYNLYDRNWAPQCSPIYIEAMGKTSSAQTTASVSQGTDGQVGATSVSQRTDGQVLATSVSQRTDGQVIATTVPVSQISDGQIQNGGATPVSQRTDGQVIASPVPSSKAVEQMTDGQIIATSSAVQQISDGQVIATSGSAVQQKTDGQIIATSSSAVSEMTDGQIIAPTATTAPAVSQKTDGQIVATTGAPVSQKTDGQIVATTSGAPVSQKTDGQIVATTSAVVAAVSPSASTSVQQFQGDAAGRESAFASTGAFALVAAIFFSIL